MITQERLRELLDYDPCTGIFTWIKKSGPRIKVGYVAGASSEGYRNIGIDGVSYGAHRLAWLYINGRWPKEQIDHINMDRSDNRISNLRECSRSQNLNNAGAKKGLYKGVYFDSSRGKYQAQLEHKGKTYTFGYYPTPMLAAMAYNKKARELHGEFARSNEVIWGYG